MDLLFLLQNQLNTLAATLQLPFALMVTQSALGQDKSGLEIYVIERVEEDETTSQVATGDFMYLSAFLMGAQFCVASLLPVDDMETDEDLTRRYKELGREFAQYNDILTYYKTYMVELMSEMGQGDVFASRFVNTLDLSTHFLNIDAASQNTLLTVNHRQMFIALAFNALCEYLLHKEGYFG